MGKRKAICKQAQVSKQEVAAAQQSQCNPSCQKGKTAMTASDKKGGGARTGMLADWWAESIAATEREKQEAIGNIRQLPAARPLHYHLSHDVMPAYFADPANIGVLRQIMSDPERAQELVAQLYQQTLQDFPECDCCFTPAEIVCSRQSIKILGPGTAADIPLLVFTMPRPKADKESFLACVGLVPRSEFYHNTEWRYFVVDGLVHSGWEQHTFLWEYVCHENPPDDGGFLLVNSCRPQVDALLELLAYQWDERFCTL